MSNAWIKPRRGQKVPPGISKSAPWVLKVPPGFLKIIKGRPFANLRYLSKSQREDPLQISKSSARASRMANCPLAIFLNPGIACHRRKCAFSAIKQSNLLRYSAKKKFLDMLFGGTQGSKMSLPEIALSLVNLALHIVP